MMLRDEVRPEVVVPAAVFASARDTLGAFFESISGVERTMAARDFLDVSKSRKRAEILERYAPLHGRKLLEIGSGFGTNLAAWTLAYGIDGYGVEPGTEGFDSGLAASKVLFRANGIDPARIFDAPGERLPFPDASFDIVYSANVLEHTNDPGQVLREAMRVLRPGGLLHIEVPNHLSYFEGHYLVFMPPLVHRRVLPAWLRLLGRDPAFANTLQTQINPSWCRRTLRAIAQTYPLDIISFGEELFLERLTRPFRFEAEGVASRLAWLIRTLQRLNVRNWIGASIVAARGYYPMYLTVVRH